MNIVFVNWPKCANAPDGCPYHVCLWGSHEHCFPCEEKKVGRAQMYYRYCATHMDPLSADTQSDKENLMIRTYRELVN